MEYIGTDIDTFLDIFDKHTDRGRWRLMYDRMYDRVIDNSKVLRDTGLIQADFMPLKDSLRLELSQLPEDPSWCHFSVEPLSMRTSTAAWMNMLRRASMNCNT